MASHRQVHSYCSRAAGVALVAMIVLSSGLAYGGALDSEPDHGLASERATGVASPDMTAFFQGSGAAALPEAAAGRNGSSDPIWDLTGQAARAGSGTTPESTVAGRGGSNGGGARRALLAAGITFGLLGLGFLAGAAFLYAKHVRARAAAREDGGRFHHLELL